MTENKNFLTGEEALDALYSESYDDNSPDPIRVVFHLKQRMKERNLTQTQLAEIANVRQATISQLSRGHIERLHIPTLERIASALKIYDIRQLVTFDLESEIMNAANPYRIEPGNDSDSE